MFTPFPANPFTAFKADTTRWDIHNARAGLCLPACLRFGPGQHQAEAAVWNFDANHVKIITSSNSVLEFMVPGE